MGADLGDWNVDKTMRPSGLVVVTGLQADDGREISTQQAVDYGWITPARGRQPTGWGLKRSDLVLGRNLFTDSGRQCLAYSIGNKTPYGDYAIAAFGVGTGTVIPRVTDTGLGNPLAFYGDPAATEKPVDLVDFPGAFMVRVSYGLGLDEANGNLITEIGLFTAGGTLIARKLETGINKSSEFSPRLAWLLRL